MTRTAQQLREDLLAIWNAGVNGVRVDRLIRNTVSLDDNTLHIAGESYPLSGINRIMILGGGKASGAMAESLEIILKQLFGQKEILGWVNVPADCAKPLSKIVLHPARPMGVNEPTEAAVTGTNKMLELARTLTPNDLCLCLISGGGSALLPAPVPEISLSEKLELTRFLSESGATIQELNTVRKQISLIKGGGLKKICHGKRLVSLILSDVLGDPLDIIASGPTVDSNSSAADALAVLRKYLDTENKNSSNPRVQALKNIEQYLQTQLTRHPNSVSQNPIHESQTSDHRNIIIGNLATAVEAAGEEALRRGYSHAMHVTRKSEGLAEEIGVHLADAAFDMKDSVTSVTNCLIHGGEPVVKLVPSERRGLGGRNQQLVLAALIRLLERRKNKNQDVSESFGIAILSGGTDGEDGPTDAAGAWIDPIFWNEFQKRIKNEPNFNPQTFLQNNDAYHFFEPLGTLLKTGVTGTNVCDLRVVLVERDDCDSEKF